MATYWIVLQRFLSGLQTRPGTTTWRRILLKPVVASHVKMVMGIVVYEENRKGDLIYNFNDYYGKNLVINIEELVLMGPAVPGLERELITDHYTEPGYNQALLQVIQFHLFSILASLLISFSNC